MLRGGNLNSKKSKYNNTKGTKKNKYMIKNQIPYALGIFSLALIFGIFLYTMSFDLSFYWIIGLCFGFILQRSRFCFTASFRDPYLTGSTALTRALLLAFALTSIGFTVIKYLYYVNRNIIPGMEYVAPISFATAVGAFFFGIGMVISGGCASGTLMRIGEGFQLQMITLVFFIIGSVWGAYDFKWWEDNFISKGFKVFLPDIFGWIGGLFVNLIIILIIYLIAKKWEEKKL